MKTLLMLMFGCLLTVASMAQNKEVKTSEPDKKKKTFLVEASCGQCKFALSGKSCDLAIRINNKAYFVDGTKIDDHGDAHAQDGFCEAIRMAKVQGEIKDDRFKATYFQLQPDKPKKKKVD